MATSAEEQSVWKEFHYHSSMFWIIFEPGSSAAHL